MEPETRLSLALAVSLLIWLPSLAALLRGEAPVERALVWYVVGLVLAWLAIGGVGHLLASYTRDTADRASASVPEAGAVDPSPVESDSPDVAPDERDARTEVLERESPPDRVPGNVAAGA
jgi:hypothetical protein